MLAVVCVFSYIMLAIIYVSVCISELQALDDLLVFYNEYPEHELD